jgi:hypothetical protein
MRLDFIGIQEVTWEKGGIVRAEDFFFYRKEMKIKWEQDLSYTTEKDPQLRELSLLVI